MFWAKSENGMERYWTVELMKQFVQTIRWLYCVYCSDLFVTLRKARTEEIRKQTSATKTLRYINITEHH